MRTITEDAAKVIIYHGLVHQRRWVIILLHDCDYKFVKPHFVECPLYINGFPVRHYNHVCETINELVTVVNNDANLRNYLCKTFTVTVLRHTTIAFAAKLCNFCCEIFTVISCRFYDKQRWLLLRNFATSVVRLLRWWLSNNVTSHDFCCNKFSDFGYETFRFSWRDRIYYFYWLNSLSFYRLIQN